MAEKPRYQLNTIGAKGDNETRFCYTLDGVAAAMKEQMQQLFVQKKDSDPHVIFVVKNNTKDT